MSRPTAPSFLPQSHHQARVQAPRSSSLGPHATPMSAQNRKPETF